MAMTFCYTTCVTVIGTYKAGDVIRPIAQHSAWSDCLILGFTAQDQYGDVYVKLARPYAYASCVGTTAPTVLQGVEIFEVPVSKICEDQIVSIGEYRTMVAPPTAGNTVDARP